MRSNPPAAGTWKKRSKRWMAEARRERIRMDFPSGYHSATTSISGCQVSRAGSPPSTGTVKASRLPSYSPVNATVFPSGESLGKRSIPSWAVRRAATPPARGTVHRSPA